MVRLLKQNYTCESDGKITKQIFTCESDNKTLRQHFVNVMCKVPKFQSHPFLSLFLAFFLLLLQRKEYNFTSKFIFFSLHIMATCTLKFVSLDHKAGCHSLFYFCRLQHATYKTKPNLQVKANKRVCITSKLLLQFITEREIMSDPNQPYSF